MQNYYPGACQVCRAPVEARKGEYDPKTKKVTCAACAGIRVNAPPRVSASRSGKGVAFKPLSFLGDDLFAKYRTAIAGTRYEAEDKTNVAPMDKALGIIAGLTESGFVVDVPPDISAALQAMKAEQRSLIQGAAERATEIDKRLQDRGLVLFPFQRIGIKWLASRTGALLADEMGLGKTIQVVVALPERAPTFVCCAAVAKGVWAREIARWRPDLKPIVLEGRGAFRWPQPGEVIITNFDILPAPPNAGLRPGTPTITGAPVRGTVLVGDEVHAIKSSKSKRTVAFRELSRLVLADNGRVWMTTGTPLLNRPSELWNILQAADIAREAFGSWNQFVADFRGVPGQYGGYEWGIPNEASIIPKLRKVMLRRMRVDVLPELPTKTWQRVPVDLASKDRKAIDKTTKHLLSLMPTAWDKILSDDDPFECEGSKSDKLRPEDIENARESMLATDSANFEAMSHGRTLLATAKIPALLEFVEDFEEQGEPLVVFSAHRAPIDFLATREGWAVITGDTPTAERTRVEDAFQAGKLKGIGGTIKAMGVAITLTYAHHELFVDREFTPGDNDQAEDRTCRIGQTRGVVIHDLVANHPLDRILHEILATKRTIIEASINAARRTDSEDEPYQLPEVDFLALKKLAEEEAAKAQAAANLAAERKQRARDEHLAYTVERNAAKAHGRVVSTVYLAPRRRGPANPREEWALRALVTLNRLDPDMARSLNDVGFNSRDSGYGHHLGERIYDGLTDREWEAAAALCTKYWRQVGRPPEAT